MTFFSLPLLLLPLPTLSIKPWRVCISSLRSSFHFIISSPLVTKDTAPALTPFSPLKTTVSPRWSIMCCYLPPTFPQQVLCNSILLLCPALQSTLVTVHRVAT